MVIYFSGTGNSRFAAEFLAKELQDELVDAGQLIKAGQTGNFQSEKPWIFAAPTYSWRMPRIFSEFLRKSNFAGCREAWFVLTCGGEIGEAGKYAQALCQEKNLSYQGALPVILPDNFITMFSVPGEEKIREMIENAKPVLENGAAQIRRGEPFPEAQHGLLDKLKSGPINEGFNRYFLRSTGFRAGDGCISCGKCAELCVLNNIHLENGKPVWGDSCTQCMACICRCPVEAIEYGKRTRGKKRYYCPEVN